MKLETRETVLNCVWKCWPVFNMQAKKGIIQLLKKTEMKHCVASSCTMLKDGMLAKARPSSKGGVTDGRSKHFGVLR